jgi:hypothetical protein
MAQTWHERVVELLNIAEAERDALRARVAELENLYAEADARANLYEGLLSVESSTSAKLRAQISELEAAAKLADTVCEAAAAYCYLPYGSDRTDERRELGRAVDVWLSKD